MLFIFFAIPVLASGCAIYPEGFESPGTAIIGLYTGPLDHLSVVSVGQCPMYPSCSHYARIAIKKHGSVIGWFMACDRLIRCGRDETDYALKVPVNGRWRYFDPVSANDFWRQKEKDIQAPAPRQSEKEVKWIVKPINSNP
ncbi:MAG: membrane protein insertion efficiency factor YidD [Deltaproteobacteria bacterium]|nr:membrane protein insertion efficiency factor YidD [Deltaproteobacteria bacterium]